MKAWPKVVLGEVLKQDFQYLSEPEPRLYPKLSVKLYGRGVILDTPADGSSVKMRKHQLARVGQVILSEIWAKKGAIGIVPPEGSGALCTSHFFLFDIDESKVLHGYIGWLLRGNYFESQLNVEARGTTGYAAIRPKQFLATAIPLPSIPEQRAIVARLDALAAKTREVEVHLDAVERDAERLVRSYIFRPAGDQPIKRPMSELVQQRPTDISVDRTAQYRFAGVYSFGRGVFPSVVKAGSEFAYERLSTIHAGDFTYPKLMAWEGALGVVPPACDGMVVSPEFPVFGINTDEVLPEVLDIYFRTPEVWPALAELSGGTNVRRRRLQPSAFLSYRMPVPPMATQLKVREAFRRIEALKSKHAAIRQANAALIPATMERIFSIDVPAHA